MERQPLYLKPQSEPCGESDRREVVTDLLKPSEVARMLQVSRTWLYDAAKDGRIPSVRLGGPDGPGRFVGRTSSRGSSAPVERGARGSAARGRRGGAPA